MKKDKRKKRIRIDDYWQKQLKDNRIIVNNRDTPFNVAHYRNR